MLAARAGHVGPCKLLVEAKAPVNSKDKLKRSALVLATRNGRLCTLSYLLSIGAKPNDADSSKNSAVHYAAAPWPLSTDDTIHRTAAGLGRQGYIGSGYSALYRCCGSALTD